MKKEYMQPTMLVVEMNVNEQMLAGSVTSVVTNLDPPMSSFPPRSLSTAGKMPWDMSST